MRHHSWPQVVTEQLSVHNVVRSRTSRRGAQELDEMHQSYKNSGEWRTITQKHLRTYLLSQVHNHHTNTCAFPHLHSHACPRQHFFTLTHLHTCTHPHVLVRTCVRAHLHSYTRTATQRQAHINETHTAKLYTRCRRFTMRIFPTFPQLRIKRFGTDTCAHGLTSTHVHTFRSAHLHLSTVLHTHFCPVNTE